VDLTVREWVEELGLPYDGTVKGARTLYKHQIFRTLDSLLIMGRIERREPLWDDNREGRCIVVHIPAGVAQSVRAAES
jgi:hypothetical protein